MKDFKPDSTPIERSTSSLILQKMSALNPASRTGGAGRGLLLILLVGGAFFGGYYFSKRHVTSAPATPAVSVPAEAPAAIAPAAPVVPASTPVPVPPPHAVVPPPHVAAPAPAPVAVQSAPAPATPPPAAAPAPHVAPAAPVTDFTIAGTNGIRVVRYGPVDRKRIALTFDDGPHPTVTPKVLEVLKEQQVKGTFFVLGDRIRQHPELLHMITDGGHEIGNHTYSHRLLTAMSTNLIEREVSETQELIRTAAGVETHMFRPPYGAYRASTKEILQRYGLNIVLWSVDPEDWKHTKDPQHIVDTITNRVQNGSIVVCHDIYKTTLGVLPDLITCLKNMGYDMVTVNDLCGVPNSTPIGAGTAPAPSSVPVAPAAPALPPAAAPGTTPPPGAAPAGTNAAPH